MESENKKQNLADKWRSEILRRGPSGTTQHLLLVLAAHMGESGQCMGAIRGIANISGRSDKCIVRHLAAAEKAGWLKRERIGKGRDWRKTIFTPAFPET
jgi:predicted transcriptional regulator